MYESPIRLIESQLRTEVENEIFRAIQEVGVDVDKDELIKALQYDRDQYQKGYEDGIKDLADKLKAEKFTHRNFGKLVYVEDIDNIAKYLTEQ